MRVLEWILIFGSLVVMWLALAAFGVEWRGRRRPVRDAQGRWRMPRRYHNGWGE